jgi:hypothetical protein
MLSRELAVQNVAKAHFFVKIALHTVSCLVTIIGVYAVVLHTSTHISMSMVQGERSKSARKREEFP